MADRSTPRSGVLGVLTDRAFWLGLIGIGVGLVAFLLLLNFAIMPLWTRHSAAVEVPDVREMQAVEAERALRDRGLEGEVREQPYNPNLANDVVVDQNPLPGMEVKPGRRIYFYVNASPKELAEMPDVTSLSEGVARPKITEAGLSVGRVEIDSVRTPYENTVTRQVPVAGRRIPVGTRVTLWLSPGVGTEQVTVPDVTGLTPREARDRIRAAGLWVDSPRATGERVLWQEPARGEKKREGEEVAIHTTPRPGGEG